MLIFEAQPVRKLWSSSLSGASTWHNHPPLRLKEAGIGIPATAEKGIPSPKLSGAKAR
jgi:hypothetical protein